VKYIKKDEKIIIDKQKNSRNRQFYKKNL